MLSALSHHNQLKDLVQPARGFGTHGHRDMEIATYVVEGELSHKDSMGTSETLGPQSVQYMSSGTGVTHSEQNSHPTKPVRFIQTWILPRHKRTKPNYGSLSGSIVQCDNKWFHLLGDIENDGKDMAACRVNQDINAYVIKLRGDSIDDTLTIQEGRMAYVLCVEGSVSISGAFPPKIISRHDAAEIYGPTKTIFKSVSVDEGSHILLFEMRLDVNGGRSDLNLDSDKEL